MWSRRADSNRLPADYESAALPTELRRHSKKTTTLFMDQNQEKISPGRLIDIISVGDYNVDCIGLSGSEQAYFVSRLYMAHREPVVVIVPSTKDAEKYMEDLRFFLGKNKSPLVYFPPYNILPFQHLSYHNETAAKRIRSLYRLIVDDVPQIVVTTVVGLLQRIIPKQELSDYAELIMMGEEIDRDLLVEKLISGGYVRSTITEEPGDFCVRGGILDVFSPLYSNPLRIELFGDTVVSLRFFSTANQRTIKNIQEAVILPAREAVLKMHCIDQIIGRIREQASRLDLPMTKARSLIDRIRNERVLPGIESLIPLIYSDLHTVFDYMPGHALFILKEPAELEKVADQSQQQASNCFASACNDTRLCVEPDRLYLKWSEAKKVFKHKKLLTVKKLSVSKVFLDNGQASRVFNFTVKDNTDISLELKRRREKALFSPLANWINDQKQSGCATLIVCKNRTQADKLKSLLIPYGTHLRFIEHFPDVKPCENQVYACIGQISSGFVWPAEFLAIITDYEIFGSKHRARRKQIQKVRTELLGFEDLKKGDLVVHVEHGIGQYNGLVKLKLNGSNNDFLLIVYKDDDKLYLPVDRMSMVQKYIGVDGIEPVLDKMGGKSWDRIKARVKKSAEKIAGELLKLFAERKIKQGYAFREVDTDFFDFEAGFPYEETSDQLDAIEDVLNDMKASIPMDRLVCGDVGYGKTEVALRASLMAVSDGKQVAVLVPTTVLAEQHFATFSSRFERYPINVACLNRFRSIGEQRKIIGDLKAGKIDIIIGTHRLIQKDVAFKDLGLLVLDEEQRFGVKHKEKLKKIRSTMDVLALTATPIPRTLHMSLMGIRDISVISTPPEYRKSIITYICEIDDAVISEAILNELNRKGQIFFVHNNIHGIWAMAKHLQKLVPGVRLDVAHGRLEDDALERVMLRFINKEIDLLVCTSIIESGLDISSANTILINRADRFGLAQIYQLRGRVGRLDEQAYAYLFIPDESTLSKDARKRLKVLMEHSDLGSGFQIAMSDLQIRGGGTILGASQSGHIAAVGYDMFLKLMENSMAELKGEEIQESLEPEINIALPASIPESYIPDIDQRLSAYRRLTKMTKVDEIADFKIEMVDRFGALPVEASNLLLKVMFRVLAITAGVKRLDLKGSQLFLGFSEAHLKNPAGVLHMIASGGRRFEFTRDHVLTAELSKTNRAGLLTQIKNILKEIVQHVNSQKFM
ncbi:MAG: transcription-repair coupling factor (superfamily II helicase) [Desulfobacteraceae bacterium Eth-SRB2]|nr:MAG: transcription-repair coupling factor (superfamily II helicase) [Desulfobacteraceae bacterium Eth-SRB2]